jgi:hypothetical protein
MTEKTVRPHSVLRRAMLVGTAGVADAARRWYHPMTIRRR